MYQTIDPYPCFIQTNSQFSQAHTSHPAWVPGTQSLVPITHFSRFVTHFTHLLFHLNFNRLYFETIQTLFKVGFKKEISKLFQSNAKKSKLSNIDF